MTGQKTYDSFQLLKQLRQRIAVRFSLLDDKADDAAIDEIIRNGAELKGATPWILIFAIFIASIGLNVNSTAVIIGAMLVSPLMGPIMGVGYGIGIYDFPLIRKSLLNLGIATLIGLLTSAFYFAISPLSDAQSELLARTSPTIWDVLVAFFGGLAGIIGLTRKEKSNVIPGVAIATALMPPLCTAGYGLATQNWTFFVGAFYLFAINCVFIAFSTVLVIEILRLSHRQFVDAQTERRVKRVLVGVVVLTMLPSVYLAIKLVKEEAFNSSARQFVKREFDFKQTHVTALEVSPAQQRVKVTLIGEPLSKAVIETIQSRLVATNGLASAALVVQQAGDNRIDVTTLKAGIVSDLYRNSLHDLSVKLEEVDRLKAEIARTATLQVQAKDIALELKAQYPKINEVVTGHGIRVATGKPQAEQNVFILSAKSSQPLSLAERQRIENWFQVRVKSNAIQLFIEAPRKTQTQQKISSRLG